LGRAGVPHGRSLRGVAAQRSRFHLAYRLAVRSYSVADVLKRGNRRAAVAGLAVSLGADLGIWAVLRQTDRLMMGPRLVADVIDSAAWSQSVPGPPEAATLPGVPLALEAGIRMGPWAMAIPAAHLAVMTAVRRRQGRPTPPAVLVWQVMGVGMGMWVGWYERRQREATTAEHQRELAARQAAARLAGQNDVAMGADTVVDEVARVEHLMAAIATETAPSSPSVGTARALAEWKASLAAATSEQSVYLATVLTRWQRANYGVALADDAVLLISSDEGMTILSAAQASHLERRLRQLAPQGEVTVTVPADGAPIVPGDEVRLRVGDVPVVLPAELDLMPPFDPAPIVIVAGGVWCLGLASSGHGDVPWFVAVPAASASAVLAVLAHRAIQRTGAVDPERLVASSIGVALVQALITTPRLRAPFDFQGGQVFPLLMTANATSALAGRYWRGLSRPARARLGLAAAGAMGVSLLLFEGPIHWGSAAIQLVETASLFATFDRVQRELDRDHDELIDEITVGDHETTATAYAEGRRFVLDLVDATIVTARRALERADGDLAARDRAEVERRLVAADARLAELRR